MSNGVDPADFEVIKNILTQFANYRGTIAGRQNTYRNASKALALSDVLAPAIIGHLYQLAVDPAKKLSLLTAVDQKTFIAYAEDIVADVLSLIDTFTKPNSNRPQPLIGGNDAGQGRR